MKTTDVEAKQNNNNAAEPWRSLLLDKEVLVKSIHPHVLIRFKTGEEQTPKPKSEGDAADKPAQDSKPAEAAGKQDDDYDDEYFSYSGDGEELPDEVQPIPFDFGGESDISINDFVRRVKPPKVKKIKPPKSRKLGTVYNGWKAASRMLQHIVTNTNLDRKRFIRKLLNYRLVKKHA